MDDKAQEKFVHEGSEAANELEARIKPLFEGLPEHVIGAALYSIIDKQSQKVRMLLGTLILSRACFEECDCAKCVADRAPKAKA